jgi:OOP family OmpA-OmpF porin
MNNMLASRLVRIGRAALIAGTALAPAAFAQQPEECPKCKDLPLLSRYPGSVLVGQDHREFDEVKVPDSKYAQTPDFQKAFASTRELAGRVDKLFYHSPKGRSATEVYANYEESLTKAGFLPMFSCKGDDGCGSSFSYGLTSMNSLPGTGLVATQGMPDAEKPRYLFARLPREKGDMFVSLLVAELAQRGSAGVFITLVETKPMQSGMVVVDATALDRGLKDTGKIAVYGVYFDVDSARIKPDSKAQLDQIASLLRKDVKLKLLITGHTDGTGDFQHNMKLSADRAAAVVDALVKDYSIERSRLTAAGLGSASPVAPNDTDEGRAKNRRVELVRVS